MPQCDCPPLACAPTIAGRHRPISAYAHHALRGAISSHPAHRVFLHASGARFPSCPASLRPLARVLLARRDVANRHWRFCRYRSAHPNRRQCVSGFRPALSAFHFARPLRIPPQPLIFAPRPQRFGRDGLPHAHCLARRWLFQPHCGHLLAPAKRRLKRFRRRKSHLANLPNAPVAPSVWLHRSVLPPCGYNRPIAINHLPARPISGPAKARFAILRLHGAPPNRPATKRGSKAANRQHKRQGSPPHWADFAPGLRPRA